MHTYICIYIYIHILFEARALQTDPNLWVNLTGAQAPHIRRSGNAVRQGMRQKPPRPEVKVDRSGVRLIESRTVHASNTLDERKDMTLNV